MACAKSVFVSLVLAILPALALASSNTSRDPRSDPRPPQALAQFGAPVETVEEERGGPQTPCRAWWDNGKSDGRNGLNSQVLYAGARGEQIMFESLVADDFFLQFGRCYWIDSIEVVMGVFGVSTPNVTLRVFEDCNGRPGIPVFDPLINPEMINEGPVPGWPGFTRYRFVFNTDLFEYGYRRLWISPVGMGTGLYYWLTANNGVIQGAQAQYRSAQMGAPNWKDVDQLGSNFGICSDFSFRICGKCCWLLKDNADYDTTGLPQATLAMGTVFGTRVVDNFQVPPGDDLVICRVEAWMATNCDPKRAFMEIYNDHCDAPTGYPLVLASPDYEIVRVRGNVLIVQGLPVYRFSFTCPPITLTAGQTYWLSMAALGVGTPFEKALWLFKKKSECHINISEGQFKSPFFAAFKSFTPVSHPGLAGEPRDFAFRLYGSEGEPDFWTRFPYGPVDLEALIPDPEPEAGGRGEQSDAVIEE
ncbi:MAG TPA: hypothetical protein DEB06_02260 [Phycisphaerales bacterium]|nr:hypothetical protein [Phycisphaerales bacterium]